MKLKYALAVLATGMMLFSCGKEAKEQKETPVLIVSTDTLKLSCEAAQPVITVSSNRAWTIQMPEACDWITPDPLSGGKEGKGSVDVEVTLTVAAYKSMAPREYTFYVVPDDPAAELVPVVVRQSGAAASIAVSSPNPVDEISNAGADVTITIVSNTAWTVAVKAGATASVTLDKSSGNGDGTVTATVAPNLSIDPLSATVVISARGCADIEVVLNQKPADIVPEVHAEIPEANVYIDPSVFSSLGGTRWFAVKSNVAWTASVGSGTTATGVSIKTASGTGDLDKFEVSAGPNKDFDNRKSVEIVFTAAGMEPVKVTLAQEKASILAFEFRNQDNSAASWPFAEEVATEAGNRGPGEFTVADYTVAYNAITDCMIESKYGWRIGKGIGGWIQTPAIAGRKLSKVTIADYNVNYNPTVTTADDAMTVLNRGRYEDLDKAFERNVPVTWTLAGTEANKSYRIVCNADKTMRVMHLVLEYAEPSAPDPAYLSATPSSIADIPYSGGSASISVSSNIGWTASVKVGATASVTLDPASGTGNGDIGVTVGTNADEEIKSAVVVISAAGCPDVEVSVSQAKAPAAASIDASLAVKGADWYVEPGVLSSLGCDNSKANAWYGKRPVYINAKKAWTARVGAETTASGVVLSETSGEAGESVLYVAAGPNTDFNNSKKIVVELLAAGEDPVKVEFTQEPAKVLTFEFRSFDRSALCWPFQEAAYTETGHSGSGTYTAGNCVVGYNAAADNLAEDGYGWRLGSGTACYIETPAVAGHKLVKISLADGNANTNPHILTTDGTEVSGGAFADKSGTYSKGSVVTWTLSSTENGTAYRITPTANKTMRTLYLVFEYE